MARIERVYPLHQLLTGRHIAVSIVGVTEARMIDLNAIDMPERQLDKFLNTAYRILSETPKHHVIIRFSANASKWIADKNLHQKQQPKTIIVKENDI